MLLTFSICDISLFQKNIHTKIELREEHLVEFQFFANKKFWNLILYHILSVNSLFTVICRHYFELY